MLWGMKYLKIVWGKNLVRRKGFANLKILEFLTARSGVIVCRSYALKACTAHLPRSMTIGFFLGDERELVIRIGAAIPTASKGTFLPSWRR